jgi:hypothetical protein
LYTTANSNTDSFYTTCCIYFICEKRVENCKQIKMALCTEKWFSVRNNLLNSAVELLNLRGVESLNVADKLIFKVCLPVQPDVSTLLPKSMQFDLNPIACVAAYEDIP